MGRIILSINMSLDGFADHTVAVHADDEMHDFFTDLLDNIAIAVLGRVTFELMQDYWPHAHDDPSATASTLAFADKYNAIRKIVFSRTLQKVEWSNSSIERGDLIDEYWLVVHPVIVGGGKRLFEGIKRRMELRPVDTTILKSGVTVLHYLRPTD